MINTPVTQKLIERGRKIGEGVSPKEYGDSVNELITITERITEMYQVKIANLEEQNRLKDKLIAIYERENKMAKAIYGITG